MNNKINHTNHTKHTSLDLLRQRYALDEETNTFDINLRLDNLEPLTGSRYTTPSGTPWNSAASGS